MRNGLLSGALLILFGTSAHAADKAVETVKGSTKTPVQWLEQMIDAMHHSDFAGTYVHVRGDQIDTMRLTHVINAKGEQERLTAMNGEARDVIRTNAHCECTWPQRHEIVFGDFPGISARLSGTRFGKPEKLVNNYRIVSLGRARVADRPCSLIALVPRDELRYGYKLCIGDKQHLMLRMSIYNEHGMPVEHNFFTEVHMLKEKPVLKMDAPNAVPKGYRVVKVDAAGQGKSVADNKGWIVSPLPAGYREKSRIWRHNPVTGNRFEHIVLSDGLSTASVFVEAAPKSKTPRNLASLSGMNMSIRRDGDMRITVIGDMPAATVDMLCKNTHPVAAHAANQEAPAATGQSGATRH